MHVLTGLWASPTHEGETTGSDTTVMQDARDGDDMRPFHNRQPVFLDAARAAVWLDHDTGYGICSPCAQIDFIGSLASQLGFVGDFVPSRVDDHCT